MLNPGAVQEVDGWGGTSPPAGCEVLPWLFEVCCAGVSWQAYRLNDATKRNLNRVPWAFAEMFSFHPAHARLES